ncbi:hypothetical protein TSH7_01435 [Azospirillum sp. TSH7]|uniref:helix-turn-helix transcriptional regulator n=1 Tax=unclassified Azospirillum TaxID=2630922 RepID=UPI000D61F6E0|nr:MULTISPECIES: helix-turn-helix transcriptional regulator [unclassified Azospirillum]PWC69134.1 hypothetical protein TSH7_01435 [Azospirillum sp. TSH7]PWC71374.1 hypothetical protein TSH20_03640 [Azospirillum sp. TSH20]
MSISNDYFLIRNAIVRAREAAGMSVAEAARRLGVARSTVSAWETGQNFIPADKLFGYAKLVGLRIVANVEPSPIELAVRRAAPALEAVQ